MKKQLFTFILIIFIAGLAKAALYPPTLVSPINNIANQMPNVLLNWSAIPGAFFYKVEVSTDSLFGTSKKYSTNLTAINASNLQFDSKYFWRVKGLNATDSSAWSGTGTFFSIKTVNIVKPENNTINRTISAYIKWSAIGGVTGYEYQIDSSLTFASPYLVKSIIAGNKIEAYSKQLAFNQIYFLRMRAIHAEDTSNWSTVVSFTTLNNVVAKSPATNSINRPVVDSLDWDWTGAKFYEYIMDVDSLFTSPVVHACDTTKTIKTTNDTILRVFTDTLLFGQKYFWKVRAFNTYGYSDWSNEMSFTTFNKLALYEPANAAVNVPVLTTFKWDSVKKVREYILQIDENVSFTSPIEHIIPYSSKGKYTLTSNLANSTPYYWRVRAVAANDTSDWSDVRTFTTISPASIENYLAVEFSASIYPNPSLNGKLNIQVATTSELPVRIQLLNMVGQEIDNQIFDVRTGNNNFNLDIGNNNNGIYFIKLNQGENTQTRKIILNK